MLSKNSQGLWTDGSGYVAAVMLRQTGKSGDGRNFYAFVANPYDAPRVIEWLDGEAVNLEPGAFQHLVSKGAARAVSDADLAPKADDQPDAAPEEDENLIAADDAAKPRRGRPPKNRE